MTTMISMEDLRNVVSSRNDPKTSGYKDSQLLALLNGISSYISSAPDESGQVLNNALYGVSTHIPKEEITRDKYMIYDPTPKYTTRQN
jgi:hypothetical protein